MERLDARYMLATVMGDFNGDGFDDLAVGSPYEDVGTKSDAGAVNIIFGAPAGITTAGNRWIHQDSAGIAGVAGPGDRFGWALAAGDFNGDGFDDLAIGVPGEDVSSKIDAGAINIIFGAAFDPGDRTLEGVAQVADLGCRTQAVGQFERRLAGLHLAHGSLQQGKRF